MELMKKKKMMMMNEKRDATFHPWQSSTSPIS
jgi:hypothetical protein